MDTLTDKQLKPVINRISEREQIVDPHVQYKYSTDAGSGYIGIINAIQLKGKNKCLELILKHAPASEKLREQAPVAESFVREIEFYETVMPALAKFQSDRGIKRPFESVAKCFATESNVGEELLMLENLKTQGYDVFDRQTTMNGEHVEFVFNEYGKFHAISYAMKDQNAKAYNELTCNMTDVLKLFLGRGPLKGLMSKVCENIIPLFNEKPDIRECYSRFCDQIIDLLMNYEKDDYSVITHGDCWCNNMMFKYDEENRTKPSSMRLIDFQLVREASPVFDLSYFFYVCVSKDIMDDVDKYLKIYHNSLSKHLRDLGSDPEKLFPYTELLAQWKKYSYFGLAMAGMLIKIMLSDKDEVPNLVAEAEAGGDIGDSFLYETKYEEEYQKRIKDVVCHFYEKEFLNVCLK